MVILFLKKCKKVLLYNPVRDSDFFSLFHARAMLINSPFTIFICLIILTSIPLTSESNDPHCFQNQQPLGLSYFPGLLINFESVYLFGEGAKNINKLMPQVFDVTFG